MLSDKLKKLRNTTTLTQSEFAKKIDVARTTYAMYEQGNREPDYATLQRIADYFDVTTDYLLGRTENSKTQNTIALSNKLKQLRDNTELSQEGLAGIIDVDWRTYARYEQGNGEIDYAKLQKIADVYTVTIDELLGKTNIAGPMNAGRTVLSRILGKKIRDLRESDNIQQNEFAKRIGVSDIVLSRYESGESNPDSDTLQKIATYFNVTTDYLLGRTDTVMPKQVVQQTTDEEFEAFANNPELERWYKDLPNSEEEDLEALKQMWEIIKKNKK